MTVSVEIEVARKAGALTLPLDAVRDLASAPWVLAIRDGRARRVPVGIGVRGAARVEILSGLAAGDRVDPRRRGQGRRGGQGPGEAGDGRVDALRADRRVPLPARGALPDGADPLRRRRRGGGHRLSRGPHHRPAGRPDRADARDPAAHRAAPAGRRRALRGPPGARRDGVRPGGQARPAAALDRRLAAGPGGRRRHAGRHGRVPDGLRPGVRRAGERAEIGGAPRHRAGAVPEDRAGGPQAGRRALPRGRRGRGHRRGPREGPRRLGRRQGPPRRRRGAHAGGHGGRDLRPGAAGPEPPLGPHHAAVRADAARPGRRRDEHRPRW